MNLLFLLIVGCFLWGCKIRLTGFAEDYISPYNSRCFRGILAVMVMCYHLAQKTKDRSLFHLFVFFGFVLVAYFFFLSGYGLQKSYATKPGYRTKILTNRIPGLVVSFALLLVVYWALRWFEGSYMTPLKLIRSVFSSQQVVSYSWYVRCLVLFYVVFYVSTSFLKGNHILIPVVNLLAVLCYAMVVKNLGFRDYWYTTCITFPLGIFWAIVEEKCLPRVKKYYFVLLPVLIVAFSGLFAAICLSLVETGLLAVYWACSTAFVLMVLLLQMKITFHNKVLAWLGTHSLEIYLIHGFFIKLYRGNHIRITEPVLLVSAVVLSTLAASWGFHLLVAKIMKK